MVSRLNNALVGNQKPTRADSAYKTTNTNLYAYMISIELANRVRTGLRLWGFKQDFNGRSSKYETWSNPDYSWKIFIGKHGAIRQGRTVVDSSSISEPTNLFLPRGYSSPVYFKLMNAEMLFAIAHIKEQAREATINH